MYKLVLAGLQQMGKSLRILCITIVIPLSKGPNTNGKELFFRQKQYSFERLRRLENFGKYPTNALGSMKCLLLHRPSPVEDWYQQTRLNFGRIFLVFP